MKIGELSERAAVSRDTIRFYERNGLIRSSPSNAPTNSYRDYPEETVLTIELIREAKVAGFTLAELRLFMDQMEASAKEGVIGEAFLTRKIEEVEANIERSTRFLETLKATRDALESAP